LPEGRVEAADRIEAGGKGDLYNFGIGGGKETLSMGNSMLGEVIDERDSKGFFE